MKSNAVSERCIISSDKNKLQLDAVMNLLSQSYWADKRPRSVIQASIAHSICFGVYLDGKQIGFARVITDYSTTFYLCDVIID